MPWGDSGKGSWAPPPRAPRGGRDGQEPGSQAGGDAPQAGARPHGAAADAGADGGHRRRRGGGGGGGLGAHPPGDEGHGDRLPAADGTRRPHQAREEGGDRGVHGGQEAGPRLQGPEGPGRPPGGDVRRGGARGPPRRLRLPALAGLLLHALPRRHLHLPLPDPPLRHPHGELRPRADPPAEGGGAVLRAAPRGDHQRRAAGGAAPQEALRRARPPLPPPAHPAGDRPQGAGDADHGPRGPHRLRPAGPHRVAAPRREDDDPPEARQLHHDQLPQGPPHRAPHRRAPRGGHGHGADGEGGGDLLHLRRAREPPRAGGGDGHREGAPDGGVRPRRGDPARLHHAPRPGLQHGGPPLGEDPLRRRGRQRAPEAEAVLRRGPQHRGGGLPHHPRDGPHRDRQPHGRGHLRGVQGDGEQRTHPRSQDRRAAGLAGHRHHALRHAEGGAAARPGGAAAGLDPPEGPERHAARGGDGAPAGEGEEDQDQRRVPDGAEPAVGRSRGDFRPPLQGPGLPASMPA